MKTGKIIIPFILILAVMLAVPGCGKRDNGDSGDSENTESSMSGENIEESGSVPESTEKIVLVDAESITLSGDASDVVTVDGPSYIESDTFVIYADMGAELPGDMIDFVKTVMSSLEEISGMTYQNDMFNPDGREKVVTEEMQEGFDKASDTFAEGTYFGVNEDFEKMCIFVVPDSEDTWCYDNGIYLRNADLKPEGRARAVSELAGLLCLRVGNVSMGPSIDGGMKGYLTQLLVNAHPELGMAFDGFSYYNGVENSFLTEKNGSNLICTSHGFEAESIGFRFIVFIYETYNPEIIKNVYRSCSEYRALFMGTHSGTVTMQKVVQLIKKETSDNVFTDFYEWYKLNAERFGDMTYIEPETSTEAESTEAESAEGMTGAAEVPSSTERDMQAYFEWLFGK